MKIFSYSGLIRQGIFFFQGQVIVREFRDVSGKNIILQKCQEFYISAW